ncbi:MAG: beta-ketoacyl synthase [Flavobacteriales bacterium]|nr:beta-ketoacyl synthase [Flavobacteriales bacterium]
MNKAYLIADNMISSLGFNSNEHIEHLRNSRSGIKPCSDPILYPTPFQASLIDLRRLTEKQNEITSVERYTKLEQLHILSILDCLQKADIDITSSRTLFIFSTTKGNIDLLANRYKGGIDRKRSYLHEMAKAVSGYFDNPVNPVVVSNACISGVLAVNMAKDFIQLNLYDNVIVTGGDLAAEFTISGFQSFKAISEQPCRPYDASRDGITIGEACSTVVLSKEANHSTIVVAGGGSSNDANHISGPSRTGDGLMMACKKAMQEASVEVGNIDFISAHGTATVYNDEMESKAFNWLGVQDASLNSFKGYWGHTLGAAGIIEIAASAHSMKNNELYRSAGFEDTGTPEPLNVIDSYKKQEVNTVLKTASGFGGCNAATVLVKE